MQLAPKPSTDNLDLYIQLMEQQNKRQKKRVLRIGLIIGLFVAVAAAGTVFFLNNSPKSDSKEQLTYLMFQSDYLPHQEIINFLNKSSHGVIIKNDEGLTADTLLDMTSYEQWLRDQNRDMEFSVNQFTATETEEDNSNEPEINSSPLGLVIRGQLEAERPLTFSISGFRPDFTYYLDFGNGRAGRVNERYTYKYSESGNFVVKLTAKDGEGNERIIRRRIAIRLARPKDEVIADNKAEPEKAPTLVITDLGEDEDVATSTSSDVSPMEDLGFDEFGLNEGSDSDEMNAKGASSLREAEEEKVDTVVKESPKAPTNLDLSNHIFMATEVPPSFPGGNRALRRFLGKNLDYPVKALEEKVEGKVVVQFVVRADGSITSPRILQSLGYGCDEEVLQIVSEMPKWTPGLMAGKPVNSSYSLPVVFDLR
ncbi:MAG: TonB family protein [Bacteroidia bacterium]|nr:TonB family protein [Bacteroidia bacterium]